MTSQYKILRKTKWFKQYHCNLKDIYDTMRLILVHRRNKATHAFLGYIVAYEFYLPWPEPLGNRLSNGCNTYETLAEATEAFLVKQTEKP